MTQLLTDHDLPARFRPARAWYVVGLLSLLYALSFMDRFMLALVVVPVSREIGISDGGMSILLGGGFAAVYAIGGLPLAYVLDRNERRWVLFGGVIFWSIATMASAFASSFAVLAICRSGVALGEAVLTPAAVSLIADLFPAEKRGLPISVYGAVSSVMVTGSLVLNGAALALAAFLAPLHGLAPWRFAFLLVGAPGLCLALMFVATVREPVRGSMETRAPRARSPEDRGKGFVRHLADCWRFYLPFYGAIACLATYSFAVVTWVPTLLVRRFGESPASAGYLLGSIGAPAALVGIFLWPWLARRLDRGGGRNGVMTSFVISTFVIAPLLILAPLAGTRGWLLAGLAWVICGTSASGCLVQLAVQTYGPIQLRARLMALALIAINLAGYTLGPLLVATLAKAWPGDPAALGYALAQIGAVVAILSVAGLLAARAAVRRGTFREGHD